MDFLNNNWKEHLKKEDTIILHTQIAKSIIMLQCLAVFLAGIMPFFALIFLFFIEQMAIDFWIAIGIMALSLFADSILITLVYLQNKAKHFVVTNTGVYSLEGIINKNIKFVSYNRITDAAIQRDLFDQILHTGTIGISTAGGTKSAQGFSQPYEIRVLHTDQYKKVRETIFNHMK